MTQDAPKSNQISTDRLVLSSSFIDQDWLLNNAIRTQHIYLPDDPVDDEDAANKAYVDSKIASADTLAELEDVTLASLADNDLLAYDSTDERWENQSAAEAGLSTAAALTTHKSSSDHDGRYYTETESNTNFAPAAEGVTNGDSHDHVGGDGAQIDHTGLSNIGTNAHSVVDTHLASTANPHAVTAAQAVAIVDGADTVKDTHIDWGSGAGQVDADDIPDGTTNKMLTVNAQDINGAKTFSDDVTIVDDKALEFGASDATATRVLFHTGYYDEIYWS